MKKDRNNRSNLAEIPILEDSNEEESGEGRKLYEGKNAKGKNVEEDNCLGDIKGKCSS
jgi:hypothetical protein